MLDPNHPIAKLAKEDSRYHIDAYAFIFDALHHAHTEMGLGKKSNRPQASGTGASQCEEESADDADNPSDERHVTGQELCTAIRDLALKQYGFMAKSVLNNWGVKETGDFGNIVYNLIEIGQMRKADTDQREDFDKVFDFDRDLVQDFRFILTEDMT